MKYFNRSAKSLYKKEQRYQETILMTGVDTFSQI